MELNADIIAGNRHDREGHGLSRADFIRLISVIPSGAGWFAKRSILRSRGTCFLTASTKHSKSQSLLEFQVCQSTGFSTTRADSRASRSALLEMTMLGVNTARLEVVPSPY